MGNYKPFERDKMTIEEAINILCTIKNITDTTYYMNNFGQCDKAIETVINNYLKEKARADKLEKEYSKMLTILDENNLL